jgi:hypothetical protein
MRIDIAQRPFSRSPLEHCADRRYHLAMSRRIILGVLSLVLLGACGPEEDGGPDMPAPVVMGYMPTKVLAGSRLIIQGFGFVPLEEGFQALHLDGGAGGIPVNVTVPLRYIEEGDDAGNLVWDVSPSFLSAVQPGGDPFVGRISVLRLLHDRDGEGGGTDTKSLAQLEAELRSLGWIASSRRARSNRLDAVIHTASSLTPEVSGLAVQDVWLGDRVRVTGGNWLAPGEGLTLAWLDGVFTQESPPKAVPVTSLVVPLEVVSRTEAHLVVSPELFGIRPGTFSGSLRVVNSAISGTDKESVALDGLTLHLMPAFVDSVSPALVRRGQRVTVTGRGFLPSDTDLETITLLILSGTFTTLDGKEMDLTGYNSITVFPDEVPDNAFMDVVLRVIEGIDGELEGLGLIPGTFSGEVSVELFHGADSWTSPGTPIDFVIGRPLQVVFLKYLPTFDESLGRFGLQAGASLVKEGILEVCERHYLPFNVEFRETRPEDFADYAIIELTGKDPNNAGLLGLDNTSGKDNGNKRFNDVIGGKNAETEEAGYYAFGGVFLESFMSFSPAIGKGQSTLEHPRFDTVFNPFAQELGGDPMVPADLSGGAPRRDAALEATRVLGNVIGGTVAHEIGHSLGLAMVPGKPEEFHNLGDNPGWLMDSGVNRPFLERAELDGQGPEIFSQYNHDYLMEILPKD